MHSTCLVIVCSDLNVMHKIITQKSGLQHKLLKLTCKLKSYLQTIFLLLKFINSLGKLLTISCTLNLPDSLSLDEDWIRFSSGCLVLGFLGVGDADFDFNFPATLLFSEKFCFCDLDVDNIKAESF